MAHLVTFSIKKWSTFRLTKTDAIRGLVREGIWQPAGDATQQEQDDKKQTACEKSLSILFENPCSGISMCLLVLMSPVNLQLQAAITFLVHCFTEPE